LSWTWTENCSNPKEGRQLWELESGVDQTLLYLVADLAKHDNEKHKD
jgi:hypothetical protein